MEFTSRIDEDQANVLDLLSALQEKVNRMERERDDLCQTISGYETKVQYLEEQSQAQEAKIAGLSQSQAKLLEVQLQAQAQELKIQALEQLLMATTSSSRSASSPKSGPVANAPVLQRV